MGIFSRFRKPRLDEVKRTDISDVTSDPQKAEKQGLLRVLDYGLRRTEQITSLNLGPIKFAEPDRTPPPVQAPELVFIDDKTERERELPLTTEVGSGVPSPRLDKLVQASKSYDVQERSLFYQELDELFTTDAIATQARDSLVEGALSQNYNATVEPDQDFEKDPEARDMADLAGRLWNALEKTFDSSHTDMWGRALATYGNAPMEVIANRFGSILRVRNLAPYAIKINSDHQLQFKPDQQKCYIQYDAVDWTTEIGSWPAAGMFWPATRRFEWERYGTPKILEGLLYLRSLIRGNAVLPDAREAAQPQVVVRFADKAGNPVDPSVLTEYEYTTRKWKKQHGIAFGPNDEKLFNGAAEVDLLAPTTSYFNDIADLRWQASGVAMRFGMILAYLLAPDTINRATLDRIAEIINVNQYAFAIKFGMQFFLPLFQRMIAFTNLAYAAARGRNRLDQMDKLLIDPRKVQLRLEWKAKRLPERLIADADLANDCYLKGTLSRETAIEVACVALERDPEVEKQRIAQEQSDGITPPKQGAPLQIQPSRRGGAALLPAAASTERRRRGENYYLPVSDYDMDDDGNYMDIEAIRDSSSDE